MNFITLLPLISTLLPGACTKNPVTGDHDFSLIFEAEEIGQGRGYHPEIIKAPHLPIISRSILSFELLAQQSALECDALNRLRLLNRSFPDGKITDLVMLKAVTLGE
jgi:hypothetical protein